MMEYLPSREGVIAIRCGGRLEREELDTYMDRLEASLAARPKTHFFVEVVDFGGLDMAGLGDALKRSGTYFRNLDRIGRVGIVADQSWIRWAAQIESALLPHVRYETFDASERDRALAWVQGEIPLPHRPALKVIETDRPDVFAFELDGHLSKAELDAATVHFAEALAGKDQVRVLGRIRRLGGFEPGGLLSSDYFAMKRGFLERMERYALVGGPGWLRTTLNALAPLFKAEIRHFGEDEEASAWAWIEARPVSERTLVD